MLDHIKGLVSVLGLAVLYFGFTTGEPVLSALGILVTAGAISYNEE